ncbi:MAG: glycogen/starch/alpha-glucan phosphorylase, partial [Deltaproteobacteria bacterium]|nr:glycogen/starch/alpha-glucan phosphorylase [Deltaproteobacteria bacterium]
MIDPQSVRSFPTVAYFSLEIGVAPEIPTYSGGLGVLAGDTIRAAADMGLPMIAVTLLYRDGYFRQHLDAQGQQTESPVVWDPRAQLEAVETETAIELEGKPVVVRAWRHQVRGLSGHVVPRCPDEQHPAACACEHRRARESAWA